MIEAVISGIGIGLVLTFLTGPVFFALIKTSIEKGFQAGAALALGVVSSDVVFVGAIIFGSQFFDVPDKVKVWAGIFGSVILLIIGFYYIFKKAEVSYNSHTPATINRAGYFLKGFLMCIFNPGLLFHWITVIGTASTVYHQGIANRQLKIGTMFITILLVQFGMDLVKAFYANKLRDRISVTLVHRLNYIAGAALIIAAFVIFDRLVTHYIFSAITTS
jgi:threonine/homoserine/homoserine lactone efflux protein